MDTRPKRTFIKASVQMTLIALLIVVLTFLFFEGLARVIYCLNPPLNSHHINFDLKYHLAEQGPEADKTIIFLGDSLMERAAYPEYLQMLLREKGLTTDILNLATPNATPQISYYMLKHRVKDEEKKPSLLIMDITFRSFHQYWINEPVKGKNANASLANAYYGQCVFNRPKGFAKFICSVKKKSILFRHPELVSNLMLNLPEYLLWTKQEMWARREEMVSLFFKRGWFPFAKELMTPSEFDSYMEEQQAEFKHYEKKSLHAKKSDWFTEQYIKEVVTYCKTEKIPLVFVLMPEPKRFTNSFYQDALGVTPSVFYQKVKTFALKYQIPMWDIHNQLQDERLYGDVVHLNIPGAIAFNKIIAGIITKNEIYLLKEPVK